MTYKKMIIPVLVGVLVIVLLLQFSHNSKPSFDGRFTLDRKAKTPYGTYVANEIIKEEFLSAQVKVNKQPLYDWNGAQFDSGGQALIIVDNYFDPTENELDHLTAFAQKGNIVLISALEMSATAQKFFHLSQPSIYQYYSSYRFNTLFPDQAFGVYLDTAVFASKETYYYPGAKYGNKFSTSNPTFTYPLGYNEDSTLNMVAIDSKSGSLYLHAAPAVFTNFFLLYRDNHTYFRQLLSLIPPETKLIHWDEYFLRNQNQSGQKGKGILSVFFEYSSFRWAFWAVLGLIGIFLITEVQRRQRLLPVKTKPLNESLDFVETIGNLYFEKGDNKNIADKLTKLFLEQVRSKYAMATSSLDPVFIKTLSIKSGIPLIEVESVINRVKDLHLMQQVDDITLKEYYFLLDHFLRKI